MLGMWKVSTVKLLWSEEQDSNTDDLRPYPTTPDVALPLRVYPLSLSTGIHLAFEMVIPHHASIDIETYFDPVRRGSHYSTVPIRHG